MIPIQQLRTTEAKTESGEWIKVIFSQLEPGDMIRQFEPDGTAVTYKNKTEFVVKSIASIQIED